MRTVAETAVKMGDYKMAVKEASASPTYAERAKTLVFVVRSAIKEGLFDLADEAAEEIPRHKVQDSAKIDIIDARSKALSQLGKL